MNLLSKMVRRLHCSNAAPEGLYPEGTRLPVI